MAAPRNHVQMEDFRKYILNSRLANQKTADFYVNWVVQFFNHCNRHPDEEFSPDDSERYLKSKARTCEQWQLDQAREAIEVYRFWMKRRNGKSSLMRMDTRGQWKAVADQMTGMMRLKHLALKTERTYLSWMRRFYRFVNGEPPGTLESNHVRDFMTHLAVERKVAASTQNQAFSALLFLFRHVLDRPIEDINEAVRAIQKRRLPVVLTTKEVNRLLSEMTGVHKLMAQIVYGGGLRLRECLRLRVKDLDLARGVIIVRGGKGDKDRETVLPETIGPPLQVHLEEILKLYKKDRAGNQPGVEIPGGLERKYPRAGKEWAWFWAFPSSKLSTDPRSGIVRRHHLHSTVLQRHLKKAALRAKLYKRVTVHTLRHCFATHLVEKGCDIRTVQDLLGHTKLETTMIYTHVAKANRLGIVSPLDEKT